MVVLKKLSRLRKLVTLKFDKHELYPFFNMSLACCLTEHLFKYRRPFKNYGSNEELYS